jgi:UDP-N-acetylglucosamine--N-acetylmuramyl-(pentapeptide) pyrophosphoryl-undecaprenol N-acetylglucosamine transferase
MEVSLIARAGIPFQAIPAAGMHGVGLSQLPGNLWRLIRGSFGARASIRDFNPDVIFFTGGYVGVPVAFASGNIAKVVYTPDIEPGVALRLISRRADLVTVTSADSIGYYGKRKVKVTGYPTRKSLVSIDQVEARDKFDLADDFPVLLVMGGSRGARSINQALWHVLKDLLRTVQIIHLTGELDFPQMESNLSDLPKDLSERYHPFDYLHERMPFALAATDLVLSRAGASALGEYTVLGLPSILVPYPHAWRYQKVNAAYLADRGAAVVLPDEQLNQRLMATVLEIINDRDRLNSMSDAAAGLGNPGAAELIASELLQYEGRSS